MDRCGLFWIDVYRCGSILIDVDVNRCGLLWVDVDRCGYNEPRAIHNDP